MNQIDRKIYSLCPSCNNCPTAEEQEIGNMRGLLIKDDFGGAVRLTDKELAELVSIIRKRTR